MSPIAVHIGIPTLDGRPVYECMAGVLAAWSRWPCTVNIVRGSVTPHNRDILTADFLADNSTHLLSVDSDMEWSADDLAKLLALDLPFVFGRYVGKRPGAPLMCSRFIDDDEPLERDGIRLEQWDRCGAGFVLLQRSAVERMCAHYALTDTYTDLQGRKLIGLWQTPGLVARPHDWSRGDHHCARCMAIPHVGMPACDSVAETDDYAFCRRWRAIGGKIYTRPDVALGHVGHHVWRVPQ